MLLFLLSKTFRRLVAAALLGALAVVLGTAGRVWWVARQDDHPRSDVLVVLGASQLDGRPSAVLRARLDHAVQLYDEHVAPRVITVGGDRPGDRFTEAEAGQRYLAGKGVTSVVAVPTGSNTLTSLRAVAALMKSRGWRSAVIVTDPWHSLRSRRMAQDLGLTAHTSPTRTGPAVRSRTREIRYVARETAAYLSYWVFGGSAEPGRAAG